MSYTYEIRPRKDHRDVDLVSNALPFSRLWHGEQNARFRRVSFNAVCNL
jgi:hypothetical protein